MNEATSGVTRSFNIKGFQGFTIIETIIVLAIAGFIMLLVFYAVPTLRASSSNSARRNDAARLAAHINDFIITNSGSLPLEFGTAPGQLNITEERWAIVDPPQNSSINTFPTPDYGGLNTIIVNLGFSCQNGSLNYVGGPTF
ncbi:MAG TPA: prepilin-type N-terminal cleavage/methylation domain-containing protein, partial [Candidatus Saccharimonadales bacterium]|nr:prepilin-type N-terminal cleavage/methylation domain-containing protein [Candidatus Saccharimonadales bacterium]